MSLCLVSPRIRRKNKAGFKRKDSNLVTVQNINTAEETFSPNQLPLLLKSQLSIGNDTLDTVVLINKVASMLYEHPIFGKFFAQHGIAIEIIQEVLQDAKIVHLSKKDVLFKSTYDINKSFILIEGKVSIKLPLTYLSNDEIQKQVGVITKLYHIELDSELKKQFDLLLESTKKPKNMMKKQNSTINPKILQFNLNQKEADKKIKSRGLRNCSNQIEEVEFELFEVSNCFIGEMDLSYHPQRFYNAYARTPCYLLLIDRVCTEYLMKVIMKAESDKKVYLVDHAKSLRLLSKVHLGEFFKEIEKEIYSAKEIICTKDAESDSIYFISQGNCSTLIDNHVIYDRGDFFGLEALKHYIDIHSKSEEQATKTATTTTLSNYKTQGNIANANANENERTNSNSIPMRYGKYSNTIVANIINTIVLKIKISSIPQRIFNSFTKELLKCHLNQSEIRKNLHQLKQSQSTKFQMQYHHLHSNHRCSNPNMSKLREYYSIDQVIKHYQLNAKQKETKNSKKYKFKLLSQSKPLFNIHPLKKKCPSPSDKNNKRISTHPSQKVLQITKGRNKVSDKPNDYEMKLIYRKLTKIHLAQSDDKELFNSCHNKTLKTKSSVGDKERVKIPFNSTCSLLSVCSSPHSRSTKRSDGCSQIQLNLLTGPVKPPKKYQTLTERVQYAVNNWKRTINNDQREFETDTYIAPLFSFVTSV